MLSNQYNLKKSIFYFAVATNSSIIFYSGVQLLRKLLVRSKGAEETSKIEINLEIEDNKITPKIAVQVTSYITQYYNFYLNYKYRDLIQKRIKALNDQKSYNILSNKFFEKSEKIYKKSCLFILKQLGNIFTCEEINEELSKIPVDQLEKMLSRYDETTYDHLKNKNFDFSLTKEAYMFYGNLFISEMNKFLSCLHELKEVEKVNIYFNIHKFKCDDLLYDKYRIHEREICYLVHRLFLVYNDEEVKKLYMKVRSIEEKVSIKFSNRYMYFNKKN